LPDVNTSVPHSARSYDFILGGKDNFEADRRAAAKAMEANLHLVTAMRENHAPMRRVLAYLAGEVGVRQFLDLDLSQPVALTLFGVLHLIPDEDAPRARGGPSWSSRAKPGHNALKPGHSSRKIVTGPS
jgi:hypothetical protein